MERSLQLPPSASQSAPTFWRTTVASELTVAMARAIQVQLSMDKRSATEAAQAALQAMIDHGPTEAMVRAAMRGRDGTIPAAVVRDIWRVMIAAAQGDG
jgi:hypothetical protein